MEKLTSVWWDFYYTMCGEKVKNCGKVARSVIILRSKGKKEVI